jgi:hypothetical protein
MSHRSTIGLALLLLAATVPGFLAAETPIDQPLQVRDLGDGWFEAEGQYPAVGVTPDEAGRRAVQDARDRAVMSAVGVDVSSASLRLQEEGNSGYRDAFLSLSSQTSAGRIIEVRSSTVEGVMQQAPGGLSFPLYRARVQVRVAKEEGHADPDFQVQVQGNQSVFREGDEVRLAITATKPCYITVLDLTAADTVIVLLPHKHRQTRRVSPGDTLNVPDASETAMGIRYRAYVPAGRFTAHEAIWVVATKEEREFGAGLPQKGGYNQVPTRQAAWLELMRWLVQIPRDQRALTQVLYEVRAAAQ